MASPLISFDKLRMSGLKASLHNPIALYENRIRFFEKIFCSDMAQLQILDIPSETTSPLKAGPSALIFVPLLKYPHVRHTD